MARIKRVAASTVTGAWQLAQLEEGWYTRDYDFATDQVIMARCEDLPTITATQARLLAYSSIHDLSEKDRRTIWPELYEGD